MIQQGFNLATSEWRFVSLAEAPVEIIDGDRGKNYPKKSELKGDGHCLFLNAGNVTSDGFDFSTCEFIPTDRDQLLRKGKLIEHDVVLTTRGTVGNSAYYDDAVPYENIRINSGMVIFRALQCGIDPHFLYFVTRSPSFLSQVQVLSTGSAQPQLPIRDIKRVVIPLPSLAEQKDISHVLGNLDDKIELNRRMNRTLEEMARAIFQNWFVDFGPTRAKMEGQEPYLPPDLWGLFPDELVDSEVGGIPKGWEVEPLAHLVDLNPREAMKKGTEAPYLDMASLPTDGCSPGNPVSRGFNSGSRFRNGDTLLARITPCLENGKSAYIQCLPDGTTGWGSTEFIVMRGIPPISPVYTYLLARDQSFRSHAILSMTGTSGRQRVQTEALSTYLLPIPHEGVFEAFASAVQPLFRRMEANRKETNMLSAQRDCLLPGMVSGSVPVTTIQPLD